MTRFPSPFSIMLIAACALLGSAPTSASGNGKQFDGFTQVSKSIFLFKDTCNVYVVKSGDEAVLIDFGSGRVMDYLSDIGVRKVTWVLHSGY